ncbi:SDR family NAD(P)-dependent oxidoreductase [Crossiella cryophila]|uniref:3-oxoacyl-[acyl-carrier protein] reductase n=1 Tax=Crossiella cryophila TaxID=43355 RepID=A0A7W7FUF5_9PSEU|nr:SDR family oxidoreductase [Crossiella cryophila]MBB4677408.1 3-oxoacyl-[acyl-carrier protein] reductase [Crossiella cryophila]
MSEHNTTALVTGGAGLLGTAISRALAKAGHPVVLTYQRAADRANALAAELEAAGTPALAAPFELADPDASATLLDTIEAAGFSPVGILVNNALPQPDTRRPDLAAFTDATDASWRNLVRHNVEGTLSLIRAVLPGMLAAGYGRVVSISSTLVHSGLPGGVPYSAAKAAMHGASRSLAWEVGRAGVTVNVVTPGLIASKKAEEEIGEAIAGVTGATPIGRLVTVDEVAAAVGFLASPGAAGITGSEIVVDGGKD